MISEDLVLLGLDCGGKGEVIHAMSRRIADSGLLNDVEEFERAVLEREASYSTGIGFEIAIPHGKTDAARDFAIAYARLSKPVLWDEEELVRHVIMLAVPLDCAGDEHLRAMSQLSKKLLSEEFRNKLYHLENKREIADMILCG